METLLALPPHEEWRDIKGWEGFYQVSNLGRVRSVDRVKKIVYTNRVSFTKFFGKILAPFYDKDGYEKFCFTSGSNKRATPSGHRLVCESFHENIDNKPLVNHKNGIKNHNYEWNLEWVTEQENAQHAYDNFLIGENHPKAKLTQAQAEEIRSLYSTGNYSQESIGKMYGMKQTSIGQILSGKRYPTL